MPANPDKLKIVKEIGRPEILLCIARQEGASELFVGGSDFAIRRVDPLGEKPEFVDVGRHESYVTGLAVAGEKLISGGYDGKLIWWDAESGEQIRLIDAHEKWIRRIALSPDGGTLASVADDMVCRLWDAESGSLLRELKGHAERTPHHFPSMLYCCAFSPDGGQVATADKTGKAIVWEANSGRQAAAVEATEMYTWDPKARIHSIGGPRSLAFSPDGKLLAVGGMGQVGNIDHLEAPARVEVFDWKSGERTHEFAGSDEQKGLVERLHFHPGGDWLLAAGGDNGGLIKFLDLATSKTIMQDKAPMHVHDIAVSQDQQRIFAAGHGKLAVWELEG